MDLVWTGIEGAAVVMALVAATSAAVPVTLPSWAKVLLALCWSIVVQALAFGLKFNQNPDTLAQAILICWVAAAGAYSVVKVDYDVDARAARKKGGKT